MRHNYKIGQMVHFMYKSEPKTGVILSRQDDISAPAFELFGPGLILDDCQCVVVSTYTVAITGFDGLSLITTDEHLFSSFSELSAAISTRLEMASIRHNTDTSSGNFFDQISL